ncbi:MAG: acyltransferase family protein [Bacteroidales bacterium]|nr:acyltransferase family protein [Bacteroidales bacterium]
MSILRIFYFILLIVQYYLLIPVLTKLATTNGLLIAFAISIMSCFVIYYFRFFTDFALPLYIYAGFFSTWIVFFVLGMYLRKKSPNISNRMLIVFTMVFLGISFFETIYEYKISGFIEISVSAVKISSFIYSILLIILLFKNAHINVSNHKVLIIIGEYSYGIFLSHMLLLIYITKILELILGGLIAFSLIYQGLIVGSIITVGSALVFITRKLHKMHSIKYLGF